MSRPLVLSPRSDEYLFFERQLPSRLPSLRIAKEQLIIRLLILAPTDQGAVQAVLGLHSGRRILLPGREL